VVEDFQHQEMRRVWGGGNDAGAADGPGPAGSRVCTVEAGVEAAA